MDDWDLARRCLFAVLQFRSEYVGYRLHQLLQAFQKNSGISLKKRVGLSSPFRKLNGIFL